MDMTPWRRAGFVLVIFVGVAFLRSIDKKLGQLIKLLEDRDRP